VVGAGGPSPFLPWSRSFAAATGITPMLRKYIFHLNGKKFHLLLMNRAPNQEIYTVSLAVKQEKYGDNDEV
jgi:hypothetical protein